MRKTASTVVLAVPGHVRAIDTDAHGRFPALPPSFLTILMYMLIPALPELFE